MSNDNKKRVATQMRTVYLDNGKPLHFEMGTSDEDIALTISGYRSEEIESYGKKRKWTDIKGYDQRKYKSKTINLEMEDIPEPERKSEGWLMEDSAVDFSSAISGFYGARAGLQVPGSPQVKAGSAIVMGALASAAGSGTGEFIQYGIQQANNSPLGDRNAKEVLDTALQKGGRDGLIDLTMGVTFNRAAAGWRFMTSPRGKKSLEKLQRMLTESGTTLSLSQALDDTVIGGIIQGTEEVLRGAAWTRQPFNKLNEAQDIAFLQYTKNVAGAVSDNAIGKFKSGMFGRYVRAVHERGNRLHKEASSLLFEQLDHLQPTVYRMKTIAAEAPSAISKSLGIAPKKATEVLTAVAPVDVSGVRKFSKASAAALEKIGLPEMGPEGYTLLKNMAKGETDLTFAQAHKLMSGLKTLQRSGKLNGTPGASELVGLIKQVDEAFNTAGDMLGGDITKQYAAARKFYKTGAKAFNDKLITDLLEKSPSRIGRALGKDATIEDVDAVRRMVLEASKQKGSRINYVKTMRKVTHGVVEELLPRHVENFDNAPIFKIGQDVDLEDRLIRMIGPENTETLRVAGNTIKKLLHERGEKGALTSRQIGSASLVATGSYAVAGAAGFMGSLAAFFVVPHLASRAMASPMFVNMLVTYSKAPPTSAARRRLATKMFMFMNNVRKEVQDDPEYKSRVESGEFEEDASEPVGVSE